MTILFASLALSGTLLVVASWARPYVDRYLRLLEERQRPTPPAPPAQPTPPPQDLIAMALSESTGWAREDALAALYELHADCGADWDRTRVAFLNTSRGVMVDDATL